MISQLTATTTAIPNRLGLVIPGLRAKTDHARRALSDFSVPIKQSNRDIANQFRELIVEAEKIALQNLSGKIFINVTYVGGGSDTYAYSPGDRLAKKGVQIIPKDADYFIVSTGSLGRKDDFVIGSDADFVVFPANEDSIHFAQALQKEITAVLHELLGQNSLPYKTDEIMTGTYNYHIPPERVPSELLTPYVDELDCEFGMTIKRKSIAPDTFRDMEFISDNKQAYNRLVELITPVLYPYDQAGNITNNQGDELVRNSLDEVKCYKPDEFNVRRGIPDFKGNTLRPFQYFTWIVRAREGIKTGSVFETLETRAQRGKVGDSEAQSLASDYDFLLRAKSALAVTRQKVIPLRREEKPSLGLDIQPQIAESMGLDLESFQTACQAHIHDSIKIIASGLEFN